MNQPIDLPFYSLALDQECEGCNGLGVVINPAWEAYWESWYAFHGSHDLQGWQEAVDAEQFPPGPEGQLDPGLEDLPCEECEGKGWRPTELGAAILVLVWRYS